MIPPAGAFRGAVVLMLPQVPDNEANGRLGLARRVETFILLCTMTLVQSAAGKIKLKPVYGSQYSYKNEIV